MAPPQEILSPEDYKNYRNVRAILILFILLGGILVLAGISLAVNAKTPKGEPLNPAVGIGLAVYGLAGVVGAIAARRGNRRWAKFAYCVAVFYFFCFPLGTLLSYVLLKGFPKYLDSAELVAASTVPGEV